MKNSIEKNTQLILGFVGLFAVLIWIVSSAGLGDWSPYMYQATGIAIAVIMLIEGGVITYFQQRKYRKIDVKDFVVWLTTLTSGAVLINSLIGFQLVKQNMPAVVVSFFGNISVIVGIIAAIIIIIQMVTPRFEG